MDNIGKRIKALRYEQGMTLEELGNRVGVGRSTVRKWEEGIIQNMRRDKIVLVAKALDTTPEYLLGYNDISLDDSHIEVVLQYVLQLNAKGMNKLIDYLQDLTAMDKYRKE